MSRHIIKARSEHLEVVVGWDHPLLTFFVQVYDKRKKGSDDEIIFWKGTKIQELYEVDDVRRVVQRYAELTPEMGSTLYGDKDEGR